MQLSQICIIIYDDMFEVNSHRSSKKFYFHLVLICDETGIFDAFRILKEHIGNGRGRFLSLIYSVRKDSLNTLFEKEISILERQFSCNLCTYTLRVEPGEYDIIRETIEAIINSNPNLKIRFIIIGKEMFADYVSGVLNYLNVDTFSSNTVN